MEASLSRHLEKEFSEVSLLLDRTGHELAQAVLDGLPDPLPTRLIPGMVEQGLLRHDGRVGLTKAFGYQRVTKGCRRVDAWAAGKQLPAENQYEVVATALDCTPEEVAAACTNDRRVEQLQRTLRRAQNPAFVLVVRIMAAVYNPVTIDPRYNLREALYFACTKYMDGPGGFRRCLVLPSGLSIFISKTGTLENYSREAPSGGLLMNMLHPDNSH